MKPEGTILVVDDTPQNLRLLIDMLTQQGYKVRPARDGQSALSSAQSALPDLVLLDIMMPEMSGYEVCEALKADERTRDIPIIFISALDEMMDKVRAFSVGGVDYITKPFQTEEVLARVKTHLTISSLQKALRKQNEELDAFAHTVAHDLKIPLGSVQGYIQLSKEVALEGDGTCQEKILALLEYAQKNAARTVRIVNELLALSSIRKGEVETKPVNMAEVTAKAQQSLSLMIEDYQAEISLPDSWPTAMGHAPWLTEVWANYISNGLKYGGQPPHLEIGAAPQPDGMIRFWIKDNGAGISPEDQTTLFTEFTRLNEVRAQGHGLGLSIVRRIIDKLGGDVGVESEIGQGSVFYFTLPAAPLDLSKYQKGSITKFGYR